MKNTLKGIQQQIFQVQMVLILTLALFLGVSGTFINLHFEKEKRDQNLQNIAEAIAVSVTLFKPQTEIEEKVTSMEWQQYLDSVQDSMENIDVISIVSRDSKRLYHSNHELIGTVYDGVMPSFEADTKELDATNASGPSGLQRRAYAAIYDDDGNYVGFVITVTLMQNIQREIIQTAVVFALITLCAILIELLISMKVSGNIRKSLLGYEPDVFSAMYKIRDNILESLDEGIIATDHDGTVQFVNQAAIEMINAAAEGCDENIVGQGFETIQKEKLSGNPNILVDNILVKENETESGTVAILHNREEYTKLMEDLAGTRYLVDSMRANNHDFTNKLHVILGLIQMEMYDEATAYIENITIMQRETISKVMNAISEPAIAALLIGKMSRASELNIKFVMREGCSYFNTTIPLSSELLVTIIGNLIENAFESMNERADYDEEKELLFGIYSQPEAVLITVDDTGVGISKENLERVFENGYSTKGEGRGTGLYQVKEMVEQLGGIITAESQEGVGTSFSVSFTKQK